MRNDGENEAYLLASKWNPPGELGVPAVDPGDPIACIATTYGFEASYFENQLLPSFLGLQFDSNESGISFLVEREERLGQTPVVVLVNADHYDPCQASGRWLQLPVRVPRGMQHSKVSVLVWENLIRVIVASANLTRAGYRRNREVAAVLDFFDGEKSVPRKAIVDTLGFLREIRRNGWVRGGDEAIGRLDEALGAADNIQRRWKNLREDFRTRELPRLVFAPTTPTPTGRGVARSPLDIVRQMWGARSATSVTVVTPFVGQPPESAEEAITKLRQSFPQQATTGRLAVPGEELNGETWTKIPESFWNAWKRRWSRPGNELDPWVVKQRRPSEGIDRPLHAKALFVDNHQHILLLCGSSNFSIHGMGVGRANVEANICYLDNWTKRDRCLLYDRVGVDWEEDACNDAQWPKDVAPDEEEAIPSSPTLPLYFLWARHDEVAGTLVVGVDPQEPIPVAWRIYIRGQDGEPLSPPLAGSDENPPIGDGPLTISENSALRCRRITALCVTWQDAGELRRALLPVQVESPSGVASEIAEGFSAKSILACLVGDHAPARWVQRHSPERSQREKIKGQKRPDDAHRAVDTSGYTLYRVRQLGQALAVLARRVFETPRHRTAVRYRLFDDLLSPVRLACAIRADWLVSGTCDSAGALAFAIAELRLTIAHVFAAMPAKDRRVLRVIYCEALEAIGLPPEDGSPDSSLRDYIAQSERRCVAVMQEGKKS